MKIDEITGLIKIKEYMQSAMASYTIDKKSLNDFSIMINLIDNKIISLLQSSEFKDYLGYDNFKAEQESIKQSKISSGAVNYRHK